MNNKTQYSMKELMDHIIDENRLKDILDSYNLACISKIHNIQHYEKDDNRHGVVLDVQENKLADKTKILIDLKLGPPIVHQVYDALFDFGKDGDIKIIAYTDGYFEHDREIPVGDEYLVASILEKLHERNIPIFLFSINQHDLNVTSVALRESWYHVSRSEKASIPTPEMFWDAYFDSFNDAFYEHRNNFYEDNKDEKESIFTIYISEFFSGEIKLFWDENGVSYKIKQISDSDEYLKKVLSNYMPTLKERYGDDSVNFENVVGRLPRLYIKYSDKPFNWLNTATPWEITDFTKNMFDDAWGLRGDIEETVIKIYKKVPA